MFSIYGESGRIFKGAMEDLWRVEALRATMRARRVDLQLETIPPSAVGEHAARAVAPRVGLVGEALSAYAQASGATPERHPLAYVSDVMSRPVMTLTHDLAVLQAWQMLGRAKLGQAPVLDAQGELVGLLTRSELFSLDHLPQPDQSESAWRAMLMQPVSTVMLSPVPAVSEDMDLRRVARVLLDTHLPGLPVVSEEGRLTGFISRSDILRAVAHDPPLDLWS